MTGLAIRLAMAPFFAHPSDVYSWYYNGENLLNGTQSIWYFLQPYNYSFFLFVFPATIAFRVISSMTGTYSIPMTSLDPRLNPGAPWNIPIVPGLLFDLLVKLPLIASDLIIGVLLYKVVKKHFGDANAATSISMLWVLNPLTIWVSSGWGMFDTLPVLFTVLAFYFVLEERFGVAGISLSVAMMLKYYGVVLVFPLVFIVWRFYGKKAAIRGIFWMCLSSFGFLVPLIAGAAKGGISPLSTSMNGLRYSGLSFWSSITLFWPTTDQLLISGVLIVFSLLGVYTWIAVKSPNGKFHASSIAFALPITALLSVYWFVGENFIIWILPFAAILTLRGKIAKAGYWLISLLALLTSVTNSLVPYYLLPVAPWIGSFLVSIIVAISPYKVAPQGTVSTGVGLGKVFLSAGGILSTLILILLAISWVRGQHRSSDELHQDLSVGGGRPMGRSAPVAQVKTVTDAHSLPVQSGLFSLVESRLRREF